MEDYFMSKTYTQSITVNVPVEQAYEQYSRFERFPEFMDNVKEVRPVLGQQDVYHWETKGPLGDIEYDAKITADQTNRRIAWETVNKEKEGHEDFDMCGQIGFADLGKGQTQITSTLTIDPPAGGLGELVADVFSNPESMMEEDLKNFKKLVESRTPAVV